MSEIIVRSAQPADVQAAAVLGAQIVRVHHATNSKRFFMLDDVEAGYAWWLAQEINRPGAVVLIAELENKVVGYAYGAIEDRDWSILVDRHGAFHDLCVDEAVRRRGVGRALAVAMLKRLEGMGAPRILLRAMVQNETARRLAEQLGFATTMLEMTRESAPPSSST